MFDDSVMKTTLVADYGLVCDNSGTRTILNITYMLGIEYFIEKVLFELYNRSSGWRIFIWLDI